MKVSPVSFGSFRVKHAVETKNAKQMHEHVGKILQEHGFEYNDQTNFDEYLYPVLFKDFPDQGRILDNLYYSNNYWAKNPRVYASNFKNKDTGEEELFLTGETVSAEARAKKVLESKYGYYCTTYGLRNE